jgi:hypothetical protein
MCNILNIGGGVETARQRSPRISVLTPLRSSPVCIGLFRCTHFIKSTNNGEIACVCLYALTFLSPKLLNGFRWTRQEILRLLFNPNVYYCFHKSPPLVCIPYKSYLIHTLMDHFSNHVVEASLNPLLTDFKINVNIMIPSTPRSAEWPLLFSFSD